MLTRARLQQLFAEGWTLKGMSTDYETEGYWVLLVDEPGDTIRFPVDPEAWGLAGEVMGER
jgi:hypothetical protein